MYIDLISVISLVMIFEGILPFLNPELWKKFMLLILKQSNLFLRIMGLISMISGVFLLYVFR